jgi:predicted esterase
MTRTAAPGSLRTTRLRTSRTARCSVRGPAEPGDVRELWIALHGYGQLAASLANDLGAIDDGTRLIVAPEGLSRFYFAKPFESHREAPVGASWMTRADRLEEIADHLEWLQLAYEHHAAPLAADVPLTVLGFSQGAAAATRWVASGKVRPRHVVCWGAGIAPELDLGPDSPLRRAHVTLVHGVRDRIVSREAVDAERARLDAAGFPHDYVEFQGGHRLDDATLERLASEVT